MGQRGGAQWPVLGGIALFSNPDPRELPGFRGASKLWLSLCLPSLAHANSLINPQSSASMQNPDERRWKGSEIKDNPGINRNLRISRLSLFRPAQSPASAQRESPVLRGACDCHHQCLHFHCPAVPSWKEPLVHWSAAVRKPLLPNAECTRNGL